MNIKYDNINNNLCFICLDNIDHYIKFDCGCYNYLHTNCISDITLTKCFICHKKINYINLPLNNHPILYSDVDFINNVIKKINMEYILNYMIIFTKNNPNFVGLAIYFIVSIIFTFGIVIPIIILSTLVNSIKNSIKNLINNIDMNGLIIFITKNIL